MLIGAVVTGMRLALLPGAGTRGGGAKLTSTRPSGARLIWAPVCRARLAPLVPVWAGGVVRTSDADSGGAAVRREIDIAAGGEVCRGRGGIGAGAGAAAGAGAGRPRMRRASERRGAGAGAATGWGAGPGRRSTRIGAGAEVLRASPRVEAVGAAPVWRGAAAA
jgi:hypothetical protein